LWLLSPAKSATGAGPQGGSTTEKKGMRSVSFQVGGGGRVLGRQGTEEALKVQRNVYKKRPMSKKILCELLQIKSKKKKGTSPRGKKWQVKKKDKNERPSREGSAPGSKNGGAAKKFKGDIQNRSAYGYCRNAMVGRSRKKTSGEEKGRGGQAPISPLCRGAKGKEVRK